MSPLPLPFFSLLLLLTLACLIIPVLSSCNKALSRNIKVVTGHRSTLPGSSSQTLNPLKQHECIATAKASQDAEISGRPFTLNDYSSLTLNNADMALSQRQNYLDMADDAGPLMDIDDPIHNPFNQPRAGDEGADHNHKGGEQDLVDEMEEEMAFDSYH